MLVVLQNAGYMDPRGGGGGPSYILSPPAGGTIAYLYARLVPGECSFPAVRYCHVVGSRPVLVVVLRISCLVWSFRVRGGFVCPICWLGFGIGIGLLGAGFGSSVCAVVSFHLVGASCW